MVKARQPRAPTTAERGIAVAVASGQRDDWAFAAMVLLGPKLDANHIGVTESPQ
jgi:hypothetical protein